MKPRTVTTLFSTLTIALLAGSAVLAWQHISHHLWLGLALAALSASIAGNPEFVLQDVRRVLSLAAEAGGPAVPSTALAGMLLSLLFLAVWIYLTVFIR